VRSTKLRNCIRWKPCSLKHSDSVVISIVCILYVAVITELARSSKAFAELGGRTHPLVADVVVALVEMGWCCLQLYFICLHFMFLHSHLAMLVIVISFRDLQSFKIWFEFELDNSDSIQFESDGLI